MADRGFVLWFTGLSGAGKTTLARAVVNELAESRRVVELLDGDEVRETLSKGLGFSREDRDTNIRRIGFVARLLARNGVGVLVSAISPYRDVRDEVRRAVEGEGLRFIEVHVTAPIEVLVDRDVKGLYRRAIAGEIPNFTGVSDPYEEPLVPDVVVDSSREAVSVSRRRILDRLREEHLVALPTLIATP